MSIQVLKLTSQNAEGWPRWLNSVAGIADEVRDDHIESLAGGRYDFWFTPSLQSVHRQVNPMATKILYTAGGFTAAQVPLLQGTVVVTGRELDGQLRSLDNQEVQALVDSAYGPGLGMYQLDWRLSLAVRREKRRRRKRRRLHRPRYCAS